MLRLMYGGELAFKFGFWSFSDIDSIGKGVDADEIPLM